MRITTLAWLGLGLGLSLGACRGGGGDDNPDAAMVDAVKDEFRIQDVQSDTMAVGTAVKVKGVVVTAIDKWGPASVGDIWVQDPAGGPFSGVKVFRPPVDQVAMLEVGDLVDIEGAQKDEFAITSDMSGRKLTELKQVTGGMMTITKMGKGRVPDPVTVDAAAISMMDKAGRDAEWEKWEGVLITVVNARQTGAFRTFGAGGADQGEFRISGFARVQSSLTMLPTDNAFGVCYDRITGIGDYAFNDLVLPRSTADFVSGGTGCRAMSTTVVAAQTQTKPEVANLTNVFVTARDDIGTSKGIWVADALAAAPNNGVYVFTGSTLAANLVVGATVNVQGSVEEFDIAPAGMQPMGDAVTEVTGATPALVAAPGGTLPTPVVVAPATLSDLGGAGEAYEGVLVQVSTVKVTASLGSGKIELTANDGSKIIMDDESFAPATAPAVGTCYESVIGVMHVQLTDNIRTINPRAVTDLVNGTGCN
jgi:predicted extracellular nuclease